MLEVGLPTHRTACSLRRLSAIDVQLARTTRSGVLIAVAAAATPPS